MRVSLFFYALILYCLLSVPASASDKDQKLLITLNDQGCVANVIQPESEPANCPNRSDCKKQDGCICIKPDKRIDWQIIPATMFRLFPKEGSGWPMKKCKYKRGVLTCKVDKQAEPGDYFYNIEVEGCDLIFDPRIVIGRIQ